MAKKKKTGYGDVGAAIARLQGGDGGGLGFNIVSEPFMQDAFTIAKAGTAGAVGVGAVAALMTKTPVGGWLGRLQAPALLVGGLGLGPLVGKLSPTAGLGVGAGLFLTGLYALIAGPLGLPMTQAAPAPAQTVNGWGNVFGGRGGSLGRLGAGSRAEDLLLGIPPDDVMVAYEERFGQRGLGVHDPKQLNGGGRLGVIRPTQINGAMGPGPRGTAASYG